MASTITIGRAPDNTIVVGQEFETVSNRHADLSIDDDGRLTFTDHSSNGTNINGREIRNQSVAVAVGDEIRLADKFPLEWESVMAAMPDLKRAESKRTRRRGSLDPMGPQAGDVAGNAPAEQEVVDTTGTERFGNQEAFMSHFSGSQADNYGDFRSGVNDDRDGHKSKKNKKEKKQSVHRSNGTGGRRFPWMTVFLCFVAFLAVMSILAFTVFDDVVKNLM